MEVRIPIERYDELVTGLGQPAVECSRLSLVVRLTQYLQPRISLLHGEVRGRVAGAVVDDDDFEFARIARLGDRLESVRNRRAFVVRGDENRDAGVLVRCASLGPPVDQQ